MDGAHFDLIARRLAGLTSRRGLVGALVLGAAAQLAGSYGASASRPTCRRSGVGCTRPTQCCSGVCATGRNLPRAQRNRCQCVPDCSGGCLVDDGCGGVCPGCADDQVCDSDTNVCRPPCEGVIGYCFFSAEGGVHLFPGGCSSQDSFHEGCTTDAECAAEQVYIDSYLPVHGTNVEAVCVRHHYYHYAQPSEYDDFDQASPNGRCYGKPPANGTCWE